MSDPDIHLINESRLLLDEWVRDVIALRPHIHAETLKKASDDVAKAEQIAKTAVAQLKAEQKRNAKTYQILGSIIAYTSAVEEEWEDDNEATVIDYKARLITLINAIAEAWRAVSRNPRADLE